jgi:hypothetical protein
MEGRTAAGSLIIACGTFLPDGVTCMSDIKPGEQNQQSNSGQTPDKQHC